MMDTTKKLLRNIPEHLLYFAAADLISMLTAIFVNLLLRPLLTELARGDAAREAAIDRVLWGVFAVLFFVVLAVLLYKSSGMKNRYLAETIGVPYSFVRDYLSFIKGGWLTGIAAYLVFALPLTVVMTFFPDLPVLPTLFYPQCALIELFGNTFVAWAVGGAGYALFSAVYFPVLHAIWEKNRIYRG